MMYAQNIVITITNFDFFRPTTKCGSPASVVVESDADLLWTKRPWSGSSAYAESKLCDVLLAFAVARRWKDVKTNALEPGWVATKMGGPSAPDDLHQGCVTQAWLATSEDELARSSGGYFYHQRPRAPNPIAADLRTQEELLTECGRISGIPLD